MKKFFKRFSIVAFVMAFCFATNTVAMAAEAGENVSNEANATQSNSDTVVGFSLGEFGNASQTALRESGSKSVWFDSSPNRITYIVLPNGRGTPQAKISIQGQFGDISLICDGQSHTINVPQSASILAGHSYTVQYKGAYNVLSISLVFSN